MPRTLAQNAEYIANTIKPAIKSAIEAQGVTVPSTDSFLDYADRIGEIEGGGEEYVDGIIYHVESDYGKNSYIVLPSVDSSLVNSTEATVEVCAKITGVTYATTQPATIAAVGDTQNDRDLMVMIGFFQPQNYGLGRLSVIGGPTSGSASYVAYNGSYYTDWVSGATHTVSVTMGQSSLKIYVDGELKYETSSYSYYGKSNMIPFITERGYGKNRTDSQYQTEGEVFNIRVYAKALTASEIAENVAIDQSRYIP